jgi:large subunit ribosomal protein L35
MPKMKTHRAGAKRYKVTANGKVLRRQAGKKHLLTHKSSGRRRSLSGMVEVSETNLEKIKLELPYMQYSR